MEWWSCSAGGRLKGCVAVAQSCGVEVGCGRRAGNRIGDEGEIVRLERLRSVFGG